MQKTIIGIVVTTIVLYLWGFLYWGVSPIPYSFQKQTSDDAAAQEILAEHFPESGTYYIPGAGNEPEVRTSLYETGPRGFVHIQHGETSEGNLTVMIGGFVLNLAVVSLMAFFFIMAGASEFRDFVRLSIVAGAIAVIAIDVGDMIWWQIPFEWKIWQLIYDYTLWLIAGHLLGVFMKEPD